jgi:aspartyl-tRNA(Asn)/glutamyl-tRNA(Gln) amidotransferase subunit A
MIRHFQNALAHVDAILTPSTAIAAPPILPGALPDGESDLSKTVEIMRFATQANMTGLPAASFPAGYTAQGLPIGIGRAWEEAALLRLAVNAEEVVERRKPRVWYGVL